VVSRANVVLVFAIGFFDERKRYESGQCASPPQTVGSIFVFWAGGRRGGHRPPPPRGSNIKAPRPPLVRRGPRWGAESSPSGPGREETRRLQGRHQTEGRFKNPLGSNTLGFKDFLGSVGGIESLRRTQQASKKKKKKKPCFLGIPSAGKTRGTLEFSSQISTKPKDGFPTCGPPPWRKGGPPPGGFRFGFRRFPHHHASALR